MIRSGFFPVVTIMLSAHLSLGADEINYSRDIRPILSAKCWHCHGPDAKARQGELRLDQQLSAHARRESGTAIVPGFPEQSLLIQRIMDVDPEVHMPPVEQPRQLTAREVELLKRWVSQGGSYEKHWAFEPPVRPAVPAVSIPGLARNAIDRFVLRQLALEGLAPSPEADRRTLIRRLSLDLTGLPPGPGAVDRFVSDAQPAAYERLVDRLLASPQYGERMALTWLDAARFADSGGYQGDILRSMWLWRDWVIKAYNSNMPFDQFTIEQLAGDLLPAPTEAQRIATGFNRNHRINDEDGIVLEEFRVEYVADRVETTGTVWLGLTLVCAKCHDHKYDAITQQDYYRFFAFFNNITEEGRGHGNAPPLLRKLSASVKAQIMGLDEKISLEKEKETLAALQKKRGQLLAAAPSVMVMQEREVRRPTHVLIRGAYDRPGEIVQPGFLPVVTPVVNSRPSVQEGETLNRLDLARWIMHPDNPLTARVVVNRYWRNYFGRGLVESLEDFGSQGVVPTNRELLDWLATEFVRTRWDVKGMQRLIVTSATYRQASVGSAELVRRDPENRLLGRAARFRLPAETLRDQALAAAGLLIRQVGGPSVKPYQPPGLWNELASASRKYEQGKGADLYRRSMYTFIRRTIAPPAMTTIDAPNREICIMRRPRTNTPTQALVLMNDPQLVEAARALAELTLRGQVGQPDAAAVSRMLERVLARPGRRAELEILTRSLQHYRQRYRADPGAAEKMIAIGESRPAGGLEAVELAAWTVLANLVLNLDETLTRE
jgi:hypothetical protein